MTRKRKTTSKKPKAKTHRWRRARMRPPTSLLAFAVSTLGISPFFSSFGFAGISVKHPHNLLTPDYGIVTEDDLAFDEFSQHIQPYNPNDTLGSLHWQCLPLKEVTARFESWRGQDGGGPSNKTYRMCTVVIEVRHSEELQIYADRRAHRVEFCRDFIRAWKRITKDEKVVCLNGDGGGFETDEHGQKYKLWTWYKFKARNGCYSYFSWDCETAGCASGKCRR